MPGKFNDGGSGSAYGHSRTTTADRSSIVRLNMASDYYYVSGGAQYRSSAGSLVVNDVNLALLNMDALGNSAREYMTPPVATGYYRLTSTTTAPTGGWPYYQWTANDVRQLVTVTDGGLASARGVGSTA